MPEPWLLADPGDLELGAEVVLGRDEACHARGPLRCRAGDIVVLADGEGTVARSRLVACDRSRVTAEVAGVERVPRPGSGVTVALAVLHTKAMDWAVQKSVEVGAEAFVPAICDRSQLSLDAAAGRCGHWRRVARQAIKQCRRPWAMRVHDPKDPGQVVQLADGPGVVADPDGGSAFELPAAICRWLVVGPEGGLTEDELTLFDRAGWLRVGLGPNTLRAETAAVVGTAILGMRLRQG